MYHIILSANPLIGQNILDPNSIVTFRVIWLWLFFGYAGGLSFLLFMFVMLLAINREALFWFFRRFSRKIAIIEIDDTGSLDFKAEKSIGQGVIRGNEPNQYSMMPRNLSRNLGAYVNEETNLRFNQAVAEIIKNTPKDQEIKIPDTLYTEIRSQVVTELKDTSQDVLEVADHLNSFRSYTKGLRIPVFIRYSGKAIVVNPIVGVVASQDRNAKIQVPKPGKSGEYLYARVQDLKTFFTRMITPSQVTYISKRSEMIGAKQLSEGPSMMFYLFIGLSLVGILAIVILYVLPALGVKL